MPIGVMIFVLLLLLRDWIQESKRRTGMPKRFDGYHKKIVDWLTIPIIVSLIVSFLFVSDGPKGQEKTEIAQDSIAQINRRIKIKN